MNVQQMMSILSLRLEDAANLSFSDAMKVKALNNANNNICHKLHYNYLTELQILESDVDADSGYMAMSSLKYNVLRGSQGILKVKINGDLFCHNFF